MGSGGGEGGRRTWTDAMKWSTQLFSYLTKLGFLDIVMILIIRRMP